MKFLKIFFFSLLFLSLTIFIFTNYYLFYPLYHLKKSSFIIEKNTSYENIISLIEESLVLSPWQSKLLDLYIRLRHDDQKIQTGDFTSRLQNKDFSLKDLIDLLIVSNEKAEIKITLIEGWTNQNINEYLKKTLNLEDFQKETDNIAVFQEKYTFLQENPGLTSLQGYLFPDTYFVYDDISATEIVDKLLSNFQNKVMGQMLADLQKQNRTLQDAIILASILEKEVRTLEAKKKVADIFLKRLKKNQPLQSDATINFITQKGTDRPSLDDLKTDSLYNTYKYAGLPPGPICNPGLDSIIAAIYPDPNPYFYFLTTPDGKIFYAITYEEHLKNKYNYLP